MIELGTEIRWQMRRFKLPIERIRRSEELGYDAVFTAENIGSDGLIPLGYIAAHTSRLKLGTRVVQIDVRSAVATVMAFQTLNHMTGGGRVICGLGLGSPEVTEGMYGRPSARPVARMRETVSLLRQGFAGKPFQMDGRAITIPYKGADARNYPPRACQLDPLGDIPIYTGATRPMMLELCGEIADGWMTSHWTPSTARYALPILAKGLAKRGRTLDGFKIWGHVDVIVTDDISTNMRLIKEYVVTWSKRMRPLIVARGYADMANRLDEITGAASPDIDIHHVREAIGEKRWQEAVDAVPDDYVDEGWLLGPLERIRARTPPWLESGVTGLAIRYGPMYTHEAPEENLDVYRVIAEVAGKVSRSGAVCPAPR